MFISLFKTIYLYNNEIFILNKENKMYNRDYLSNQSSQYTQESSQNCALTKSNISTIC